MQQIARIVLGIYLLHKLLFFLLYSLQFADHDQATIWLMAADYASGNFQSLFFYGQNYNVALDALLAAPLVYIGISPHIAVGIAMLLLSSSAVFIVWKHNMNQANYTAALLTPALFLLGPFTLHYLFSTGISSATLIVLAAAFISARLSNKLYIFLLWSCMAFAAFGVMNALPLLLWSVVYMSVTLDYKSRISAAIGILAGYGLLQFGASFTQASAIVHQNFDMQNGFDILYKNILHLPELFYGLGPILDYAGISIFVVSIWAGFWLFRQNKKAAGLATLLACAMMLAMMATDKVLDHHQNAYFTGARYFLSIVGVFLLSLAHFPPIQLTKQQQYILLFGTITYSILFFSTLRKTANSHIQRNQSTGVMSTNELKNHFVAAQKCLGGLENKTIVSMDHPTLMYAMKAWNRECKTLFLPYDRRREDYLNFYNSELHEIWLLDVRVPAGNKGTKDNIHVKGYTVRQIHCGNLLLYHIKGNGLTAKDFMEKSGWEWWQRL